MEHKSAEHQSHRPTHLHAAIPNLLSLSRLILGIAFPALPSSWRLAVVAVAGLTEFLDGALSRLWHVTSQTGRLLDPVADKVFVLAVFGTLTFEGAILFWELPLIGARDLMVLGGCAYVAIRRGRQALTGVPPRLLGKLATTCQFAYMVLALLDWAPLRPVLFITAAVSVAAGIDYLIHGAVNPVPEPNAPKK